MSNTVRLFQGTIAYVGLSPIHRFGSIPFESNILNIIFLCTGVFCGNTPIQENEEICTIPIYYLEAATFYDIQSAYGWETDYNKFKIRDKFTPLHCDGSCFSACVVKPDGFGQFVNTCNPASSNRAVRRANAYYHMDSRDSPFVTVRASRIIMPNEEILADYHWHLATVLWPVHEQMAIEDHVASCRKCLEARSLQQKYERYVSTDGGAEALYESSAGMYQLFLSQYFSLQELLPTPRIDNSDYYLLRCVNKPLPYSSGGVTQQSMIAVLKQVPQSTGAFLQIGSQLGLECWLASFYLESPGHSSCIAVLPNLQDAVVADIVANETLKKVSPKLLDSSGAPLRQPIPYTVMCVPAPRLGMTELLRAAAAGTLLISADLPEAEARGIADIAALAGSTVRTIITFSTVVRDHVLAKEGWPGKGLVPVECIDMDVGPSRERMCYVLTRGGGGKRSRDPPSRTAQEEMQALQYFATQIQPYNNDVLKFNMASINTLMKHHAALDACVMGSSDDASSTDSGCPLPKARVKTKDAASAVVADPLLPDSNPSERLVNIEATVEFVAASTQTVQESPPLGFPSVSAESFGCLLNENSTVEYPAVPEELFGCLLNENSTVESPAVPEESFGGLLNENSTVESPAVPEESFTSLLNVYSTVEYQSQQAPLVPDDVARAAAWHNGLGRLNLSEHVVAGDGNCLFRAVCHQVSNIRRRGAAITNALLLPQPHTCHIMCK